MTWPVRLGVHAAAEEHGQVRPELAHRRHLAAARVRRREHLVEEDAEPAGRPRERADVIVEVSLGHAAQLLLVVGDVAQVLLGQRELAHRPGDAALHQARVVGDVHRAVDLGRTGREQAERVATHEAAVAHLGHIAGHHVEAGLLLPAHLLRRNRKELVLRGRVRAARRLPVVLDEPGPEHVALTAAHALQVRLEAGVGAERHPLLELLVGAHVAQAVGAAELGAGGDGCVARELRELGGLEALAVREETIPREDAGRRSSPERRADRRAEESRAGNGLHQSYPSRKTCSGPLAPSEATSQSAPSGHFDDPG